MFSVRTRSPECFWTSLWGSEFLSVFFFFDFFMGIRISERFLDFFTGIKISECFLDFFMGIRISGCFLDFFYGDRNF